MPASSYHIRFARDPSAQPRRLELTLVDGYRTGVLLYEPPVEAPKRRPVVYLHGIQSHPGWYGASAEALAAAGHAVLQPMRRGSGDNALARGHAQNPGQLLDDLERACRLAREHTTDGPVHLLGVSWGGKLAVAYAAHHLRGVELASLTLVAPGLVPRIDAPLAQKLQIALALLVSPQRRFDIPLSEPELFTDNPPMLRYLADDPARLHRATAKFLYTSRCLDVQVKRLRPGSLTMPTTLILASRDRIINNARTERLLRRLTAQSDRDGELVVRHMRGCHTLEFEPDPQPLFDALTAAMTHGEEDQQA
jgi:alpha-beta hydrolase superfamily lysophospholipase